MSPPRLSVLMTTYNGERFLSEAIVSVLEQTFTDFEFIIVDDGSNDRSALIIRSFASYDPRVRGIFLDKNVGIPRAANRGLREVRAALVARVDSDDICAPNRFTEQVSYMDEHEYIYMLGCRSFNVDEHGSIIKDKKYKIDFARGRKMIAYLMGKGICPLQHPTLVYRTAPVRALNGYNEIFPFGEDDDLCLRLFDRYGSVLENLPQWLYFYRRHGSSITQSNKFSKVILVHLLIKYSSECRVRGLSDPLADAKELSLSSLSISGKERKRLEDRFFLRSINDLPSSEVGRQDFFARLNRVLSYDSCHPEGCLSCLVVARGCLRYGEYIYFFRYLFRAFYIDFIFVLYFFWIRIIARLGK